MDLGEQVQRAILRAGVTVIGVSIGVRASKATWRVDHLATATQAHRDTATATIAAFDPADPVVTTDAQTAPFIATSRQKDVLATCALIVRARGIPAWNALTLPQKIAATIAEADVWETIREFAEANL